MNIKNIILLLEMASLIACSENIENEQASIPANNGVADDLVPVEFSVSSLRNFDFTRATTSIVTLDAGEKVKVFVKPNGATDYSGYDYTTASSGQNNVSLNTPAMPPYYPPGINTTVEAYAYYPSTAGDTETFTVKDDQTSDTDYKASDLMYAVNRTVTKDGDNGNDCLTMEHQMAQLVITAQAQTGSSLTISEVEVEAYKSITFNPSPSATDRVSSPSNKGTITALKAAGTGYVVIPPQVVNGVIIRVKTGSGTADETATYVFTGTAGNFQSGATYNLNLTVSPDQLGLTLSVGNWNGLGSVNITPSGNLTVSPITAQEYTGQELTPDFTVYRDGTYFSPDNYDVRWVNNKESGVAYIIVTGKNMGNGADYSTCVGLTSFVITPAYGKIKYAETSVTKTYGNEPFTNPLSNFDTRDGDVENGRKADGPVTYTSSKPEVATVNEATGEVTILKAGTTTITATASSGANYVYDTTAGNHTSFYNLTVNEAAGSISFGYPTPSKNWSPTTSNNKYTQEVTKTGDGAVTYSVPDVNTTNNTCGATIVDPSTGEVTFTKSGSVVVTATVSDTEHYKYAVKTASYTLTVNKADGYVTLSSNAGTVNAGSNATITVSSSHGGTLSAAATSGGTTRVGTITVSGNTVTVPTNGNGSTSVTITVICAATDCYNAASATYNLDIEGSFDIKMNPLWYMAEFNMTSAYNSSTLTMGSTVTAGYFYTWAHAMQRFSNNTSSKLGYYWGNKSISGQSGTWHLPSAYEWNSVFPTCINPTGSSDIYVSLESQNGNFSKTLNLCFGYDDTTKGTSGTYMKESSYWYHKSSTEMYAIRYCGTNFCSVWKYKITGNSSSNNLIFTITSKLLGVALTTDEASTIYGTIDSKWDSEFDNLEFTSSNHGIDTTNGAVQRQLYGAGDHNSGSSPTANADLGRGWYWTATDYNGTYTNHVYFYDTGEYTAHGSGNTWGFSVRLFRDN